MLARIRSNEINKLIVVFLRFWQLHYMVVLPMLSVCSACKTKFPKRIVRRVKVICIHYTITHVDHSYTGDHGYYVMQMSNVGSTSPHIIGKLVSVVLANRRTM